MKSLIHEAVTKAIAENWSSAVFYAKKIQTDDGEGCGN